MSAHRYPLEPLLTMMGCTLSQAQKTLGIGGPEYRKYRDEGMSREVAERKANRAGFHVYEVWPEMVEHDYLDTTRECAAQGCSERFVPAHRNPHQKWCSRSCKSRENARRRYQEDPEFREKKRRQVKEYDAQNREVKRRANAARYRLNGEAMREYQRAYYQQQRARKAA